jgi:hypothetical protein
MTASGVQPSPALRFSSAWRAEYERTVLVARENPDTRRALGCSLEARRARPSAAHEAAR